MQGLQGHHCRARKKWRSTPNTMPQTNTHHFQYATFPLQPQHQTMNIPPPTKTSVTADTPSLLSGKTPISGNVRAQYYRSSCGTIKMNPYHPSNRGKENKCPTRDSLSAQKPCRLYPSQHHAPSSDHAPSSPPYGAGDRLFVEHMALNEISYSPTQIYDEMLKAWGELSAVTKSLKRSDVRKQGEMNVFVFSNTGIF